MIEVLDTVPRPGQEVGQRVDFVCSVEKAREHFLQSQFGISGTARAYLEDDARLSEAEPVADLVARFSRAEIEEKTLGRTVGSGIVKPLGSQLRRFLKHATPEQLDGVRAAIEGAIAHTYVSTIGLDEANDARVKGARTPEQIWCVVAPTTTPSSSRMVQAASGTTPPGRRGTGRVGAGLPRCWLGGRASQRGRGHPTGWALADDDARCLLARLR